ncbi:MAG: hypothetical protein GX365_05865, partial [Clostridiales bacterium]|nr:hypothetical protein [Clostridiales bacterium]
MVLLWILLGLVTIILILCFCPVTLFVSYIDGELDYSLKYLVFNIVKTGEKKHKKRKDKHNKKSRDLNNKKESSKKEDVTAIHPYIEESLTVKREMRNKNPKPKGKKKRRKLGSKAEGLKNDGLELTEKIKLIKDIISASRKGLKRILKSISIRDVFIDFTISDEDAYECA